MSAAARSPSPRSARPDLPRRPALALVLALALVFAPYATRVPVWLTLVLLALLGWRVWHERRGGPLPPRWLLLLLLLPTGAGINAEFGTLLGRDGGGAVLLLLIALKLLESRTRRDALLLVLLGYFALAANFFFSQGLVMSLYVVAATVVLTAVLTLWTAPDRSNVVRPRAAVQNAARLLALAAPAALALFVLFPRPDRPLWTVPIGQGAAQTGLGDDMSPGSISNLAQSDRVAFRAEFQGAPPDPRLLYWRGPVLDVFDGRTWRQGFFDARPPFVEPRGQVWRYSITMEPTDRFWILALEVPNAWGPDARITSRFQLVNRTPIVDRTRFDLTSAPDSIVGRRDYPERVQRALALPPGGNPRARELAGSWADLPPAQRVERALAFLRGGGFEYTLRPPLLPADDAVDGFLFGTRRGFCEHFAGAFAFLMRAAGVPARVVTGYQGGQLNPTGGYLIVRQLNAHAWVEVWLEGEGWRRVDPTAAAAPGRLTGRLDAALSDPEALPALGRASGGLLSQLQLRLDAVENRWNSLVVGYGGEQQRGFLARLGVGEVGGGRYLLLTALVLLVVSLPVVVWRRVRLLPADPVARAYVEFTRRLAAVGVERRPAEGPTSLARRVAELRPDLAPEVEALGEEYATLRYGPPASAARRHAFERRVRRFRPGRPR